jgi:hypothetical protein
LVVEKGKWRGRGRRMGEWMQRCWDGRMDGWMGTCHFQDAVLRSSEECRAIVAILVMAWDWGIPAGAPLLFHA